VDEFLPVHNVDSLQQLVDVLAHRAPARAGIDAPWN
jgi:uncharacterized protein with von Willebrand factor type A (vWA) domain